MDDPDRQRILAMAQQLRQQRGQKIESPEFDQEARVRLGQMIGRAALVGSECAYPASLGPRISVYRLPVRP